MLVGASVNFAPELFAGVIAAVPFVDCLTSMLDVDLPLTMIEREEWGNPTDDEEAYWRIKAYSPYDNVREVRYPRMLVTGGLNDPRVGYFEPTKWVQKLRAAHPTTRTASFSRWRCPPATMGHRAATGPGETGRSSCAFAIDAAGSRDAASSLPPESQPDAGVRSTL